MLQTFWVTFFNDVYARELTAENLCLADLAERINAASAPVKASLPLLKLCRFGSARTPDNSLRHDNNVLAASGVEGDYDGEEMPFQEAVARLEASGVAYICYTTARHHPARPRWRVLCPFSVELPPAARARYVNRLNGLLGGALSRESWGVSQSYYYGAVGGGDFDIAVGDDDKCIDEADEFDPGLPPQSPPGKGPAGQQQGKPDYPAMSEFDLIDLIKTAAHYFGPARELARRWAFQDLPQADAAANLLAAFDAVPQAQHDRKWSKSRGSIGQWVANAYAFVAKRRGTFLRAVVSRVQDEEPWRGAIRFNSFAQVIEICAPFPPLAGQARVGWRPVREVDALEALLVLQEDGFPKANITDVWRALILAAEHNPYHPVTQWLDSLVWDGEERINRLFIEYFPGELPEEEPPPGQNEESPHDRIVAYLEKTGERFMVSGVARAFDPGCKVDNVPVLVSPENFNKSRALQALVPDPAWFSDDVSPNLIDRDTKESLTGKWLIELAEIPHIRRDNERVKAFFSRQVDRFRQAYGRMSEDRKRQCVFIGTSNHLEFTSETGNRRFWPIPIARPADVAKIERDRGQLWAEAVHWYRSGLEWWLPPPVEAIAADMQDAFVEDDTMAARINGWLHGEGPRDAQGHLTAAARRKDAQGNWPPFTLADALLGIGYSLEPGAINVVTKAEEMRAARCLRQLGYRRDPHRQRRAGRQECFWTPRAVPVPRA